MNRTKVRGMLLGVAVGDALGLAVESWSRERIKQAYPDGIRDYKTPTGHKWYTGQSAGRTSDDTALTIATARGLIAAGTFDLNAQAKEMVKAMKDASLAASNQAAETKTAKAPVLGSGVPGWGYTTVKAIRNLINSVPWDESGKTQEPNLGHGNGVVMRQSPIAAWYLSPGYEEMPINQMLVDFSAITHYTKQSAIAAVVHHAVLTDCLFDPAGVYEVPLSVFEVIDICKLMASSSTTNRMFYNIDHLTNTKINMWDEFDKVRQSEGWDAERIIAEFGGGSCNVGHSLPFCYAFWVNNHDNVQLLYDVVEAGGDTDTNASIVGSMLGALHGESIFPDHLVNGLTCKDDILKLADEFCDQFGIE